MEKGTRSHFWVATKLCTLAVAVTFAPYALSHPVLYFDGEGLNALIARSTDANATPLGYDFASVFEEIRAQADGYRNTPCTYSVEIPDQDGQGSQTWSYTLSDQMPPPHPNNPRYPPWTALSRLIQKRIEVLSFVYAMTGDGSYLTNQEGYGALDMALLVANWTSWTDPGYDCGGATCLDTAHITMGVAMVYDLAYGAMTQAQRDTLLNALVNLGIRPLAADVTAANQSGGLSAWFNGYALRVTGLSVGAAAVAPEAGAQAGEWLSLASESVELFFANQGADGGTYEGQLYGSYAVDQLVTAAHVLARNGAGAGLFENAWLEKLPRFAAVFLGSNNRRLAAFGDSSESTYWGHTMFALASHGNTTAQWYLVLTGLERPSDPRTFIWARPYLEPEPLAVSGTSLFRDVGHAVLRAGFSGQPVVAVKSGPPDVVVGHNHFDSNSFTISAYGEWIASDPGYRSYFDTPKRVYTTQSVGHNTVMVDKYVSQDGASVSGGQVSLAGGRLDYLFDGVGYAKVVGKAASTYGPGTLSRFDRRIFYAKPDLVWVFDDVASEQPHEFSWLLHAPASGAVEKRSDGPDEMVIHGLKGRLEVFMAASEPLLAGYPRSFFHPGAERYGPYAEWRSQSAQSVRFAAALVPGTAHHTSLRNPGFEQGLDDWQPRFGDGSHAVDTTVSRTGSSSARISFTSQQTGYFYSEPLALLPGATIDTGCHVRAQGTGTISVRPYYMKEGSYIDNPGGESSTVDATQATDWTRLALSTTAPASGVDAVRIALQFTGTGTVWFDDAWFSATPSPENTPPARAAVLGQPAAGLVVEGSFGIDAGASLLGSGTTGPQTLVQQSTGDEIPEVSRVDFDGQLLAVGFYPGGNLKRAFLQGGTLLQVNGTTILQTSGFSSLDVKIDYDQTGCATLWATEVPTLEAPPYRVHTRVDAVFLNGTRVPFRIEQEGPDDFVVFPEGQDVGPGCETQEEEGTGDEAANDESYDGGVEQERDFEMDDGVAEWQDGTQQGDRADTVDDYDRVDSTSTPDAGVDDTGTDGDEEAELSGGCSCSARNGRASAHSWEILTLFLFLAPAHRKRRKRR